jgi:hypothetical protein
VSYLPKEKGIVDLQLEMAKRESGVLKNQIERLSQTLQETPSTLAEVSRLVTTGPKRSSFAMIKRLSKGVESTHGL